MQISSQSIKPDQTGRRRVLKRRYNFFDKVLVELAPIIALAGVFFVFRRQIADWLIVNRVAAGICVLVAPFTGRLRKYSANSLGYCGAFPSLPYCIVRILLRFSVRHSDYDCRHNR